MVHVLEALANNHMHRGGRSGRVLNGASLAAVGLCEAISANLTELASVESRVCAKRCFVRDHDRVVLKSVSHRDKLVEVGWSRTNTVQSFDRFRYCSSSAVVP